MVDNPEKTPVDVRSTISLPLFPLPQTLERPSNGCNEVAVDSRHSVTGEVQDCNGGCTQFIKGLRMPPIKLRIPRGGGGDDCAAFAAATAGFCLC